MCCISHFLSSASHVYSDESQSATSNLTSLTNLSEDRRKLPYYSILWDVNSRRFSIPCIARHSKSKQTDSPRDPYRLESSQIEILVVHSITDSEIMYVRKRNARLLCANISIFSLKAPIKIPLKSNDLSVRHFKAWQVNVITSRCVILTRETLYAVHPFHVKTIFRGR